MYSFISTLMMTALLVLPALVATLPHALADRVLSRAVLLAASPLIFVLAHGLIAGLLSRPFAGAIQAGQFARDLSSRPYARRRLYGLCWTAVYYFVPVYFVFLSIPALKTLMFRLFGYRGNLDFTTYPDTWLRDLPLLDFGPGAYLSNRATIGTNVVLNNGDLLVAGIAVGSRGLVGHLAMLAPGAQLKDRAEVGVGVAQGLSVVLEERARVGPSCTLNHGARIGSVASVGTMSYIGLNTVIGPGIKIPAGALVPRDLEIIHQEQVKEIVSSETRDLNRLRMQLAELMTQGLRGES